MGRVVYEEEVERLVAAYNEWGEHGEVYAMEGQEPTTYGKALRGVRKKDEDGSDYLLSLYDVEQAKVMSQVAVGRKENEITKAPETLKKAEISRKIITADALHTQKAISAQIISQGGDYVFPVKENQLRLYQNIQQLFAPEYPKALCKVTVPFSQKNPNGFPHGTKSQQGARAFRNTNYDHQRNAQPLFHLAGLGSSLPSLIASNVNFNIFVLAIVTALPIKWS